MIASLGAPWYTGRGPQFTKAPPIAKPAYYYLS